MTEGIMFLENSDFYFTLRVVIITLASLSMMCSVSEFKYKTKKVICILALFLLYTLLITGVLVYFFGYLGFLRLVLLVISVPGSLLIYWLDTNSPAKAVFHYTTQLLFSFYTAITVGLVNACLWDRITIDLILLAVTYPLVILFEYRFLRRHFLQLSAIAEHGWGILSLIPCSLLLLASALAFYPVHILKNPSAVTTFYLLAVVIITIYFTIFRYLSIQYHLQLSKHNMELLELQVNNLAEKLSENETTAENARIERHDTRHHFQITASLMENGDTHAALEYIHTILAQVHESDQMRYCSNPVLNAVLSSYFGQAKKEHIRLEVSLSIPERFPVDVMEFSTVVANALENAITACCGLPEAERKIVIKCIQKPSFMLEISNTYAGTVLFSEDQLPVSGKNGHGIGSRSIAAFCKKYDAVYSFHAENGWFTVKVIM